ncbi:MAG: HEAT repeat domain-containing protein, partial [Acidobacteriota bacterium]
MTTAEIQALFAQTLRGDGDSEEAWAAIHTLQLNGSREVFDFAEEWCGSSNSLKREKAVDVLSQLQRKTQHGLPNEKLFHEESYALITEMFRAEHDLGVLRAAIFALGHLDIVEAISAISMIRGYEDHPDGDLRFAVAVALGSFPNDNLSVAGLLKQMTDSDSDVRDWAVFGLGVQGNVDSPEIREALLRCLEDTNEDVREEAAAGLGKRRDRRVLPALWAMLDAGKPNSRVREAVTALLGLSDEPEGWGAGDYKEALVREF